MPNRFDLQSTFSQSTIVAQETVVQPMPSSYINADFNTTVSMTGFAMEEIFPLELTVDRLTALAKIEQGNDVPIENIDAKLDDWRQSNDQAARHEKTKWLGIEMLILEGTCSVDNEHYAQGSYLRLPTSNKNTNHLRITATTDCIVFIKYNQFLSDDSGTRVINTADTNDWLPGPVDGIEIRPLHVFDTESIMLLRWQHAAEFKPNLNPRGEEILVINGLLQNRDHLYRQFSWIRNPIEDWRTWHGNTGTLAYYKSGHFPDDPLRHNNQ